MAPHGTSKQYLVERLRRENQTALLAAVEAGKITALSAAVSLGWVRRPPRMGGSTHRAKRIQHQLRAITGEGLDAGRMMELWLGGNPSAGSLFGSREELETAWREHRSELMARWGSHARRPAAFYEFEWDGPRPAYAVERSVLWRADALSEAERSELEAEWRREFDAARGQSASERREHYEHHDIPAELITAWSAERKAARRRRRTAKGAPPKEAVVAE
jgi:hypothetical protein